MLRRSLRNLLQIKGCRAITSSDAISRTRGLNAAAIAQTKKRTTHTFRPMPVIAERTKPAIINRGARGQPCSRAFVIKLNSPAKAERSIKYLFTLQ